MGSDQRPIAVGRYLLHRKIAGGGMATIHIARLMGDVGFSRIVAAKRMHPELAEDSEFVAMFLDEARIAGKVQHRNVVGVLDVVALGNEVLLVQEYVHGVPLSVLLQRAHEMNAHVPVPVAAAIACQVLAGLHAAHETTDELGTRLQIVHRDVSPQNILISVDGTARLVDFGVAKAAMNRHVTQKGTFKGKLAYSSPEQIRGHATRQSDIYSLAIVLWEMLVGDRLHASRLTERDLIARILDGRPPLITHVLAPQKSWMGQYRWSQLASIEPVLQKALASNMRERWKTAADMEEATTAALPIASPADVAAWARAAGQDFLDERERIIAEEEVSWRRYGAQLSTVAPPALAPIALAMPRAPRASLRGGITAVIAAIGVLLLVTIALLLRDLDTAPAPARRDIVDTPSDHVPLEEILPARRRSSR